MTTSARRRVPWRVMACAAIVGLALRLLFGFSYWVGKPLTHDEQEYLALGANLAAGRGFAYAEPAEGESREQFGRAPLYPLFIAAIERGLPSVHPVVSVKIAQALIGAGTILTIALLAAGAAGPRAAALGAWGAAVYPPLVWMPAYILSETLYMALALSGVLALGALVDGPITALRKRTALPAVRRLAGAGVLAGLAALTRPAHLFFIALACAWLVWRRRPLWAFVLVLAAALALAPWTARNLREHGRIVLVASEGGVTFWTGNHPLSPGEGDMAANPAIKLDNQRLRARYPGLSPEALEPVYYREAFNTIAANPVWWLGLLVRKAFYLVVPIGPSYTLHSPRYLAASIVSYALLLPFGLAGALAIARSGRWPRALALLFVSAVLVCLVFFPQERFRAPVIDPALLVAAAGGLALRRGV